MDCVASEVGKIIRIKMGKRRMTQSYQSSYNESLSFAYTSIEEKHSVFIHAVVSVRSVPYV